MNPNNNLAPGAYQLPPDCTAFVRAGKVIVSKKLRTCVQCDRCEDCAHFGKGQIQYNGGARNVCLARPKPNGRNNGYKPHITSQQRYFAAQPRQKACELFKSKQQ